jgi:surfeit locus 1 family protein
VTELADMARRPRAPRTIALLGIAAALFTGLFVGLGIWQLERLQWKLQLIVEVDSRVHAAAVAPPGPAAWPEVTQADDEYRHVTAKGHFLNDDESLVEAVTDRGAGYWVMTPFATDQGFIVLINRGFVPSDERDPQTRPAGEIAGETAVTGLLRISEPGGGFLRGNDPAHGRWYSRDVAAIAASHGLGGVAPYFIDADATPNPGGLPVGGLTVISFPNNHFVYALTWFALAVMVAGGFGYLVYDERRQRRRPFDLVAGVDGHPAR